MQRKQLLVLPHPPFVESRHPNRTRDAILTQKGAHPEVAKSDTLERDAFLATFLQFNPRSNLAILRSGPKATIWYDGEYGKWPGPAYECK